MRFMYQCVIHVDSDMSLSVLPSTFVVGVTAVSKCPCRTQIGDVSCKVSFLQGPKRLSIYYETTKTTTARTPARNTTCHYFILVARPSH